MKKLLAIFLFLLILSPMFYYGYYPTHNIWSGLGMIGMTIICGSFGGLIGILIMKLWGIKS